MDLLDLNALSVTGLALPLNATYEERKIYYHNVLGLPSRIDRWLICNLHSPRIDFLQDYLMLSNIKSQHVNCRIDVTCEGVRSRLISEYLL